MNKLLTVFVGVILLVFLTVGSAIATSYTSTFDVAGDFSLTGFSDTTASPPVATDGPDTLEIDNPTGTYSLDVPPPGTYDWYVELNSLTLDLYGDTTPELVLGHVGPVFVGSYNAPIPALRGHISLVMSIFLHIPIII